MLEFFKKRYRNYGFWISLVSSILLVFTSFGLQIDNDYVMNIVKAVLGVFVVLGIVNDPTTGTGYGDQ